MREIAFTYHRYVLPCTIYEQDAQNHSMNDGKDYRVRWQLEFCWSLLESSAAKATEAQEYVA